MRIVDAHHHLWDPRAVRYELLRPEGVLAPLARPFRAADFDRVAGDAGVADAVAVEAASAGADPAAETAWLLAETRRSSVTSRIVAWASVERAEVGDDLEDPPGHLEFSVRTRGEQEDERDGQSGPGDPRGNDSADPTAPDLVVVDRVQDPGEEVGDEDDW